MPAKYLYALRTTTDFVSVLTIGGKQEIMRLAGPKAIERTVLYQPDEVAKLKPMLKGKGILVKAVAAKMYNEPTRRYVNFQD